MHSDEHAAADISAYLLTGMHHTTPEGRAAIAAIIRKRGSDATATVESMRHCAACIESAATHVGKLAAAERAAAMLRIGAVELERATAKPTRDPLESFWFHDQNGEITS